jgi:hypothetical protein
MNLIFGRDNAIALDGKYTILELDTIQVENSEEKITVFCAVETIPIMEMPKLESMKSLHNNLMIEYRKKNWNYCVQAMEHLMGCWNHELDTFYNHLNSRIIEYITTDPGDDWDGTVIKKVS